MNTIGGTLARWHGDMGTWGVLADSGKGMAVGKNERQRWQHGVLSLPTRQEVGETGEAGAAEGFEVLGTSEGRADESAPATFGDRNHGGWG